MTAAKVTAMTIPLTDPETQVLNTMTADFRFLLDEYEVPDSVKLIIVQAGYKNLATFAVWADDLAGMRGVITSDVIDPTEQGLAQAVAAKARLVLSQLLAAWKVALQRISDETRISSDAKALRLPTLTTRPQMIAMRRRFEAEHGRVSDLIWPCISMVEKRLEEVEEGSFTATPLSEVISIEMADDEEVTMKDIGVNVHVRRQPKAIALPATTEELRNRFKTLSISFVLAGYKHSSRLWLRTATLESWNKYTNFLLGEEVAGFQLDQEGLSVRASWTTVLGYDLAIRKRLARYVLYEEKDFDSALELAMKDLQVKERHFITPTALLSSSRTGGSSGSGSGSALAAFHGVPVPPAPIAAKGEGKKRKAAGIAAKPKGKGKGKGKKIRRTPDGRMICDFYNKVNGCTKGKECDFVHVCNLCGGDHAAASNTCRKAAA